jgi:hypothetical protein
MLVSEICVVIDNTKYITGGKAHKSVTSTGYPHWLRISHATKSRIAKLADRFANIELV